MKSPKEQCEDLGHRHRKIWRSRALDKLETVRWKQISTSWGPIRAKHLLPVDTGEACPVCHKSTWLSGQRGSRSSCPTWPGGDWSDWPLDFLLIGHCAYIFPCSSDSDTDSWHAASTKPSYEEIICPYPPTTVWKDFFGPLCFIGPLSPMLLMFRFLLDLRIGPSKNDLYNING